jgi:hypothetical protein
LPCSKCACISTFRADGTEKQYFYAWRGGPLLPGKPGTSEFVAAYNAAVAARHPKQAPPPPVDTVQTLIDKF